MGFQTVQFVSGAVLSRFWRFLARCGLVFTQVIATAIPFAPNRRHNGCEFRHLSGYRRNMRASPFGYLFICCGLLLSTTASAERWFFEPSVSVRLRYDDNINLSVDNEEDDLVRYLNADAAFGFRTEVSDVKFTLHLDDSNYRDNGEKDNRGGLLKLDSAYKLERNLLRLNGAYEVDSTLTSELETTGLVQDHKRRIKQSLSPSWSYDLTERASTQLGYSYMDVAYQDAELTGLSDYSYETMYAALTYRLSELSQVSVTAVASAYESDRTGLEYDTRGLRFGFASQLSETLSTNLSVGFERSSSKSDVAESASDTGLTLDLSLQKRWEISSLRGTLSMSESPSGDGMLHTTKLGIGYNRRLSPRTTLGINTSLVQNSSGGGRNSDGDDRRYVTFEPRLSWKATRWWTLSTSYRYRAQEYTSLDTGIARSNAIFFNVAYVWPRESVRRWQEY